MDAGKIAGDDRVESSDNGQLASVFLGKIAKGKKLDFNNSTSISSVYSSTACCTTQSGRASAFAF
jgi:hypothetical protein